MLLKSPWDTSQLENALSEFEGWFPEESENINEHRAEILDNLLTLSDPAPGSPLYAVTYAAVEPEDPAPAEVLTPCVIACGVCAANAAIFAIGLVGLRIANQKRVAELLPRQMGPAALRGLRNTINELKNAPGAYAKAKALFSLAGGIYTAGGFKAVFKVMKDEMSWLQWIRTGVTLVAQFVAWFATAGAAFIALAALTIDSAITLIQSVIDAVKKCLMSDGAAVAAPA